MPKAEVGSTKYIANKMKAKGLQRLRWYCQICEKQCRDENGFKQHTQSEGHVRAMLLVGEDPKKVINEYSRKFQHDFLQLLRTTKNEKKVHMNNFYQEYIRDKEHIHMNATKWPSLTEFAKHLGREGICRVEEGDRGLEIQWIDDSAEAIRRREDIAKKDRQAKGDENAESRALEQQIKRAQQAAKNNAKDHQPAPPVNLPVMTAPSEPVKVSLSLKGKGIAKSQDKAAMPASDAAVTIDTYSTADKAPTPPVSDEKKVADSDDEENGKTAAAAAPPPPPPPKMSFSLASKPKPSNPLSSKSSGNPFSSKNKSTGFAAAPKPMSNMERIMKEELERKRRAEERGQPGGGKRPRLG